MCAEHVQQAVSQASAALREELDEERRKYQGLLREFTRLEQRYDNLREMSLLTEVHHHICDSLKNNRVGFKLHLVSLCLFSFPPPDSAPRAIEGLTLPRV